MIGSYILFTIIAPLVILVIAFLFYIISSKPFPRIWSDLSPDELSTFEERASKIVRRGTKTKVRPEGRPLYGGWSMKGVRVYGNGILAPFARTEVDTEDGVDGDQARGVILRRWRFVPFDQISGIHPMNVRRLRERRLHGRGWEFETESIDTLNIQVETLDLEVAVIKLKEKGGRMNVDQEALRDALSKVVNELRPDLWRGEEVLYGVEFVSQRYKYYPVVDHRDNIRMRAITTQEQAYHLLDLHKHGFLRGLPGYRERRLALSRNWGLDVLDMRAHSPPTW